MKRNIAILGASPKSGRYAHMAQQRLIESGHRPIPVNPAYLQVEGLPCVPSLSQAVETAGEEGLDTVTVYLSPAHLEPLVDELVQASPRRVIFNPGSESPLVRQTLERAGIECMEACTLVLLSTGAF